VTNSAIIQVRAAILVTIGHSPPLDTQHSSSLSTEFTTSSAPAFGKRPPAAPRPARAPSLPGRHLDAQTRVSAGFCRHHGVLFGADAAAAALGGARRPEAATSVYHSRNTASSPLASAPESTPFQAGAVYIDGQGITAVQDNAAPAPPGFADAAIVSSSCAVRPSRQSDI
jgi:hypothetical protein